MNSPTPTTTRLQASEIRVGLGLGLEEVLVFNSKSENRDRAVEAVESV